MTKKDEEMCIKMCKEKKHFKRLSKKFIDQEYKKAKTYGHYIEPIEITFWVHRMNLPSIERVLEVGSVYGTDFSFIELYEKLIRKKDIK